MIAKVTDGTVFTDGRELKDGTLSAGGRHYSPDEWEKIDAAVLLKRITGSDQLGAAPLSYPIRFNDDGLCLVDKRDYDRAIVPLPPDAHGVFVVEEIR